MNIVISGSSGYLGSSLASFLYQKNHKIYTITSKNQKLYKSFSYKNILELSKDHHILNNGIDVFIIATGFNSKDSDISYLKSLNFKLDHLRKIQSLSNKVDIKKIIYLSSIHVYSNNLKGIINEHSSASNDISNYAKIHLKAEKYILTKIKNTNNIILRLSNVFGYSNHSKKGKDYLANNLIENAYKKKVIKIKSSSNFYRDLITLDFFLKSIFFIIKNQKITTNIINISSGKSIDILTLSKKIQISYKKNFLKNIEIISNFNKTKKFNFTINSKLINYRKFKVKNNITNEINLYFRSINKSNG